MNKYFFDFVKLRFCESIFLVPNSSDNLELTVSTNTDIQILLNASIMQSRQTSLAVC